MALTVHQERDLLEAVWAERDRAREAAERAERIRLHDERQRQAAAAEAERIAERDRVETADPVLCALNYLLTAVRCGVPVTPLTSPNFTKAIEDAVRCIELLKVNGRR